MSLSFFEKHLLYWIPATAASRTFLVILHWYIFCLSPGRNCTSEHSKISQQCLVCPRFQLGLWESLSGSVSETSWTCGPHGSWGGKTGGEAHNEYDQWQHCHPRVHPGPGRMGKYFGPLALLAIGIVFILIYIFILIPETPVHGSFCQLETMQVNRTSNFAENDRIIRGFFCHGKEKQSEAQPAGLGPQSVHACMHAKLLQSWPTLCDPMDCSLPGFSVHGILQTKKLKWVAMPSSRGSSWPRNRSCISCIVSCIAGRCFTVWAISYWSINGPRTCNS